MAPVITLLTDFGYQDGYVGVMKGVIVSLCPAATIVDLTHSIPHQNIAAARFSLLNAYDYFPQGAIHTAVVDPGVGTDRRAIAIQMPTGYLVGPDNGVLSGVLEQTEPIAAVSLTNPQYWLTADPSMTFHGRDVFAPVAAHLAAGVALSELGPEIAPESLLKIDVPEFQATETRITGHVQHIDHFGNIITTIPAEAIQGKNWKMQVGAVEMPHCRTYGEVAIGHALCLVGSHGWIEIAVNGSSAQERLRLAIGDEVQMHVCD